MKECGAPGLSLEYFSFGTNEIDHGSARRKGLRVATSRYHSGRRAPSTLLFESTNAKLCDESEPFKNLAQLPWPKRIAQPMPNRATIKQPKQ